MTHTNVLIVVSKRPTPGQTKTRLTTVLSSEEAAALYECFLKDTLDLMRLVPAVQLEIAFLPENEHGYFSDLAPGFGLHVQEGADLGARLDHALQYYLQAGDCNAVIMDSDSPTLPVDYLTQSFAALNDGADVVLGPCDDGGYYLIGLKQPAPRLLREVRMSTPNVTQDTLALAAEEGLRVSLLPVWYDIDEISSLRRLIDELDNNSKGLAGHTRTFLANPDLRKRIREGGLGSASRPD